jgi:hypothetical protein
LEIIEGVSMDLSMMEEKIERVRGMVRMADLNKYINIVIK